MKRRFTPILTQETPSGQEPGEAQRLLVPRQATSDRTVVHRRENEGRRSGLRARPASGSGLGLGLLSLGLTFTLALTPTGDAATAPVPLHHAQASAASLGSPRSPSSAGPRVSQAPAPAPAPTPAPAPAPAPSFALAESAAVDGAGIFLDQIVSVSTREPLPHVRLAPAPAVGQITNFSRTQIAAWIESTAPAYASTRWEGPESVQIARRTRPLEELELRDMLREALQRESVKDRGELELRLTRPWTTVAVADEPITLRVIDLPSTGVSGNFITRFELLAGEERLGRWQVSASAKVWAEILVADGPLKRGQLLSAAPISRERRDVLSLRDAAVVNVGDDVGELELRENVSSGQPIYARSLRVRPVVFRGSIVDGTIQHSGMTITLKVEVLEDGLPGHVVRVRNPRTRREMTGKVKNEQTILIPM
ncbi:MAG: flagellar basal body P-ring formation chaperone FlgA [Limisphaerales bacterium]